MSETLQHILAAANWSLCATIGWSCICRLNSSSCLANLRLRTRYSLLLAGTLASGCSPLLWGEWPGVGQTIFSAATLASLILSLTRWRSGAECPHKGDDRCTSQSRF